MTALLVAPPPTDVIRRTGSIKGGDVSETGSRIAAPPSTPPQVLHGGRSGSVQLTQLISGQILYKLEASSDKPLSSLQFVSDSVFLASCSDGSVYVADVRTSAAPQRLPPPSDESVVWWTDTSVAPQQADCKLVRLSSSGRAVVSDLRSLGGVVCRAQLDIQTRPHELKDVTVSWAPTLDGYISVSGFGGAVQIYNTRVWKTEPQDVAPLFQHRGHAVSSEQTDGALFVTSHVWHPERPRTLLSAASDGSVHVWDWVEPEPK